MGQDLYAQCGLPKCWTEDEAFQARIDAEIDAILADPELLDEAIGWRLSGSAEWQRLIHAIANLHFGAQERELAELIYTAKGLLRHAATSYAGTRVNEGWERELQGLKDDAPHD